MQLPEREKIIHTLAEWRGRMDGTEIPSLLMDAAISANPWFTPYYIQKAFEHILPWLDAGNLQEFCQRYPQREGPPARIGIVMAGNIPFAGFHDMLITLLSGNIALLKPSRQDTALIEWVVSGWKKERAGLDSALHLSRELYKPDFLVASGSNNTARYIAHRWKGIPQLIRKNRYSLAVMDERTTESEINALCKDLFLYNGLGCRNVSGLLVPEDFQVEDCLEIWRSYPAKQMNPLYLKVVALEQARLRSLRQAFYPHPYAVFLEASEPGYARMGQVRIIRYRDAAGLESLLGNETDRIQCVVGRDVRAGMTQVPGLDDFPDRIDLMEVLSDYRENRNKSEGFVKKRI
jgi:hypothetical protein